MELRADDRRARWRLGAAACRLHRPDRRLGFLLGRRILITGASGGVGRFAVQLAARAGAEVVAVARQDFSDELADLGADQIIDQPKDLSGAVDAVINLVGGEMLVEAYQRLRDVEATLISIGRVSRQAAVFPPDVLAGDRRSIQPFYLYADTHRLADDLAWLAKEATTAGSIRGSAGADHGSKLRTPSPP
jgi:NADPH:quinone reductase